jgi:regulation of enolase protein 1 (concanavalin A-like superfamily)
MAASLSQWHYANFHPSPPINPSHTFNITTSAPNDIWRKPPTLDVFNAPVVYKKLKASEFKNARVTVSAHWKTLYDQAGIYVRLPPTPTSTKPRWLKSGIEFEDGKPLLSAVVALTDTGADWSLLPLTGFDVAGKTTVEVEREKNEDGTPGTVLHVFVLNEAGERFMIREITSAFWQTEESGEVWVGAFTAKPTADEENSLTVTFSDLKVNF